MGLKALFSIKNRLASLVRSRAIKSMLFAGTPVIERIRLDRGDDGLVFTLFYKNGLMLSLGASGILDYQDREFDGFMAESRATQSREFLSMLHQIVLQSLLRYITAPRLDTRQRERAAEAASRLWLACEHRPGTAYVSATEGNSWTPGSRHETARLP